MELQKTTTRAYAEALKNSIPENIDRYLADDFEFDNSQILYVPNIEHPHGLLEKMLNAPDECTAAKALYESYSKLTPIQAAQQPFWIYLAHTELFPYVKKRWPRIGTKDNPAQYVYDHWFFSKGLNHQALSSLWWSVYLSIDNDAPESEKYKYTDFLFQYYTFRVTRFGSSKIIRHKEATIGIIKFLMAVRNIKEASNSMEDRVNFVVSHINKIGGSKQLVSLDRNFFFEELMKVCDEALTFRQHKQKNSSEEEDMDE